MFSPEIEASILVRETLYQMYSYRVFMLDPCTSDFGLSYYLKWFLYYSEKLKHLYSLYNHYRISWGF